MTDFKVHFKETDSEFSIAEKIKKDDWFDTSYNEVTSSIGNLRYPIVDNGRYGSKHPIYDTLGGIIGYLVGAESQIGYTWGCVYAGAGFWLTNQTFSATMGGGGTNISVIADVGNFLFSSKRKFKLVESFYFEEHSWKSPDVFKLLDDGRELLVITRYGFCVFETFNKTMRSKTYFQSYCDNYDFTISPKVKILAIVSSFNGRKKPIDGEYRYKNSIWLYNLDTGELVGEKTLEIDKSLNWSINFSEDGRKIRVLSDEFSTQFELTS
ncbi:hypothetical protein H2O64_17915 [Kordia sp. YSTF-M3]|uniref:Uncharacterized protein n=1 Tax=Kordia aestuariivivens TaxID=2759037 RepID=A0ABR7QDB1_9FLAO|nr:hypothetical protein [Kordia aestuariivivens]MBC8756554.1 hypothetical protein [Kordia aestuariivivens]